MKRMFSILLILSVLFLVSCGDESPKVRNFFVMDTLCEVRVYGDGGEENILGCKQLAQELEAVFSATREDSELTRFHENRSGEYAEPLAALSSYSLLLSKLTNGAFDITVGRALALWEACELLGEPPTEEQIANVLDGCGYEKLSVNGNFISTGHESLLLHFGAIAKGYAADQMIEYLKKQGAESGMVSFVSSVSVFGEREFRIGLRAPSAEDGLCGILKLKNLSLSISGNYERFYEIGGVRYGHILDPRTALPAESNLHSVAVVAESAALADALSTAVFVMGVEQATELYESGVLDFEFICLSDEGAWASPGMATLFEASDESYHPVLVGK